MSANHKLKESSTPKLGERELTLGSSFQLPDVLHKALENLCGRHLDSRRKAGVSQDGGHDLITVLGDTHTTCCGPRVIQDGEVVTTAIVLAPWIRYTGGQKETDSSQDLWDGERFCRYRVLLDERAPNVSNRKLVDPCPVRLSVSVFLSKVITRGEERVNSYGATRRNIRPLYIYDNFNQREGDATIVTAALLPVCRHYSSTRLSQGHPAHASQSS